MDTQDRRIPVPNCCDAMKKHRSIYLMMPDGYFEGDLSKPPVWMTGGFDEGGMRKSAPANFCPFCGEPVPEIEWVDRKQKVCKVTDGGYYCDTCGKRLMECRCLPPHCNWRPVKRGKKPIKIYHALKVTANEMRDSIFVFGANGTSYEHSSRGFLDTHLPPGKYRIEIGLERNYEIDLHQDTDLTEKELMNAASIEKEDA